ncbi:unnamed protein product [marine sediment metagenome]|uniref:Uncharacterized protein n=1 Tax=marine sediment metagenome TaxID=412755 RepID=X0VPQ7_9ZZZZ
MYTEVLTCEDCGLQFHYGDILYFKPVPYLLEMKDMEVTISPYCENCIKGYVLGKL